MFRSASSNKQNANEEGNNVKESENGKANSATVGSNDSDRRHQSSSPRQFNFTLQDQESNISLGHILMKEGVIASNLADDDSFAKLRRLLAEKSSYSADLLFELERHCKAKTSKKEKSFGKSEFSKLLTETIVTGLTLSEVEKLFAVSKAPNDGEQVYVNEFFVAVKGSMNRKRRQILNRTFSALDKDEIGSVDAEVIYHCYDAFRHPDVRKKIKSENEVRDEFLRNFDVMESRDMKVYRHDFMNYYSKISSCVLSDLDFENLLRDTWNFSGIHPGKPSNNSMPPYGGTSCLLAQSTAWH